MLHLLVKRVEDTEKELKQMKQKICSSNAVSKKKTQIPQIVRVSLVPQSLPSTLLIFIERRTAAWLRREKNLKVLTLDHRKHSIKLSVLFLGVPGRCQCF